MAARGLVSVRDDRSLRATVLAFARLDRELRTEINRETRAVLGPIWTESINRRLASRSHLDALVLGSGVRVKAGNPASVVAASSRRPIRGRLRPAEAWPAWEFGAAERDAYTKYTRRTQSGRRANVTRRTMRGLPQHIRTGRVIYPAFAEAAPRLASAWTQTVVRKIHEAAEAGQ